MFDELLISGAVTKKTKQGWTILFSASFQCACLVALIVIPLVYTDMLPSGMLGTSLVAAPPMPRTSPEAAHPAAPRPMVRLIDHGVLHAPRAIPKDIVMYEEPELPPESVGGIGGSGSGSGPGGDLIGLLGGPSKAPPAAPPPVPERIRLGGQIEAAKIITQTRPVYPRLALTAGIQGNVVLHAIIDNDGIVSELQVISGHPMLAKAAIEAVKQWRYEPTLLNGEPVEVDTTITVNFILGRAT